MTQHITKIELPGGRGYPVMAGDDVAAMVASVWDHRTTTAAVIGDSNTVPLFGAAVVATLETLCDEVVMLSFPEGEGHKTRRTKEQLEDALLDRGLDRSGCVVGLGGGVALDVAGFVAATYMRGIAHVNVATTLLAMVDASVGGKTGVNTDVGKNLVGAFHQPRAVLLDLGSLDSLPEVEMRNGLAEIVKHAVIGDAELLRELESLVDSGEVRPPAEVIARSVCIKADVVSLDEHESGHRQVLNLGHTVGHAIETASDHAVTHGPAVSMGLVVETALSDLQGTLKAGELERLISLLLGLGLPVVPALGFDRIRDHLARDKKTRGGQVVCARPRCLGEMDPADGRWVVPVSTDELRSAWDLACEVGNGGLPCSA